MPCKILSKKQKITAAILQYRMKMMQTAEKQFFKWRYNCHSGIAKKSNIAIYQKKILGLQQDLNPMMAFVLVLQCFTDWAKKTHTLGAGRFAEFILIVNGMKHGMKMMWTAKIQIYMKIIMTILCSIYRVKMNLNIYIDITVFQKKSWRCHVL